MRPLPVLLLLSLTCALRAQSGQRFVAVALHDVVDSRDALDDYAVTVDRLVGFLEWLRAHRWSVISLDDVHAARLGHKPLPERAILITFDDGYRSLYTRVFPLALAYRMPILAAVVGEWLDPPMETTVRYGDRELPRSRFVSWDELREMSRSGLVEIASHTHGLHRGVLGNPQGNELAAATTRRYAPGHGYEGEAAWRERISADLRASRDLLAARLGKAPRALAWPFGQYNSAAVEIAQEQGFQFALTLDPRPSDVSTPLAIARFLPTGDPERAAMVSAMQFEDPAPAVQRLVALDPAEVWAGDSVTMDERLGVVIERLRVLGATAIVLDAAASAADGRLAAAWFPNSQLPVRADVLSRLAWQCRARAGVEPYVRLPASAALGTLGERDKVLTLFRELGVFVPASGLLVEDIPGLARLGAAPSPAVTPGEAQASRRALQLGSLAPPEALILAAFRAIESSRPGLQLILVADEGATPHPAAIADLTLLRTPVQPRAVIRLAERMHGAGWLTPGIASRCGLWFTGQSPPGAWDLDAAVRAFQCHGGTAIGWAADQPLRDSPPARSVAPTVSASRFPMRF